MTSIANFQSFLDSGNMFQSSILFCFFHLVPLNIQRGILICPPLSFDLPVFQHSMHNVVVGGGAALMSQTIPVIGHTVRYCLIIQKQTNKPTNQPKKTNKTVLNIMQNEQHSFTKCLEILLSENPYNLKVNFMYSVLILLLLILVCSFIF